MAEQTPGGAVMSLVEQNAKQKSKILIHRRSIMGLVQPCDHKSQYHCAPAGGFQAERTEDVAINVKMSETFHLFN